MEYDYPLLNKVFAHYKKSGKEVDDIYLVCCQHLLEPQLKMFELFIDFGFKPDHIPVLGKIYSANSSVIDELIDLGIKVSLPPFSGKPFDEEHSYNCKVVAASIPLDKKVIILDDGAEMIRAFIDSKHQVLFAVEQTSSGFRKLENINAPFAIINVARSATKLTQESPIIARLCYERITTYIQSRDISNPSILIVGLGPIGEGVYEIFGQNNFIVEGFDIKLGHKDLLSIIHKSKPDIIVGATGASILSVDEIEKMPSDKTFHLISVSSSDREFPVANFRNHKDNAGTYADVQYKNIVFVNNGFPITFKGNRNELVPIEIEKTVCLLGGAVLDGVINRAEKTGLVNVSEGLEQLINQ